MTWTAEDIEYRLAEAFETLRRLPMPRDSNPMGYKSNMPEVVRTRQDWWAMQIEMPPEQLEEWRRDQNFTPIRAEQKAIKRMWEALEWLYRVTSKRDRAVLEMRARGFGWRKIAHKDGRSHEWLRQVANTHYQAIARHLNDFLNK